MDLGAIFKAKKAWETVSGNHPKLAPFIEDVKNKGFCENMEIAVAMRWPDGTEHKMGIRLQASDIEAITSLTGQK